MYEDTTRDELSTERRMNLSELREDIADLREIIMKLNSVVAAQNAEIAAMSREIAELRSFRNGVVVAVGSVLFGIVGFFIERTWFK